MKPHEAQVYVDGYFAGTVDDFDGISSSGCISATPGRHHVEIRAPGYETLTFEVRLDPDGSRRFPMSGELKRRHVEASCGPQGPPAVRIHQ